MSKKMRAVIPVLVLGAVTAGLFGATGARGQTAVHVFMPAEGLRTRFIDFRHDGGALRPAFAGPFGMALGDRAAARGQLFDAAQTQRMGTAHFECVVQRRITPDSGLYRCTYLLKLDDGDIVLEGLDPAGAGASDFAVVGGTGAYRSARGEATFTDTDRGTDMTINLVD